MLSNVKKAIERCTCWTTSVNFISQVTSYLGLKVEEEEEEEEEEEPQTVHPMSFTWAPHIAATVFMGR